MSEKDKYKEALRASVAGAKKKIAGSIVDNALPLDEQPVNFSVVPNQPPKYFPEFGDLPASANIPASTDQASATAMLLKARGMPYTEPQTAGGAGMRPFTHSDRTWNGSTADTRARTIEAMRTWGVANPESEYDRTMLSNAALGHNAMARSPRSPSLADQATGTNRGVRDFIEAASNILLSPEEILRRRMKETKEQIKELSKLKKKES